MSSVAPFAPKRVETQHGSYESVRIPYSTRYRYDAYPEPGYRFCGWFYGVELICTEQSINSPNPEMISAVPEFLPEYPISIRLTGYDDTYAVGINFDIPDIVSKVFLTVRNLATKKERSRMVPYGSREEIIIPSGEFKVKMDVTTVHGYTYRTIERIHTSKSKTAVFQIRNPMSVLVADDHVNIMGDVLYLKMTQAWFRKYRFLPIRRYYSQMDMIRLAGYLTINDKVLNELADALRQVTECMSEWERADTVLKFVQCMKSRSDLITTGCEDYFKLPAETLWDESGDCEDKVILLLTLYKILGYDVAFCICDVVTKGGNSKHIAAAVRVRKPRGVTVVLSGKQYVFCEPTLLSGEGNGLGVVPRNCFIAFARKA